MQARSQDIWLVEEPKTRIAAIQHLGQFITSDFCMQIYFNEFQTEFYGKCSLVLKAVLKNVPLDTININFTLLVGLVCISSMWMATTSD